MLKYKGILIFLAITLNVCVAENEWIWSQTKSNRRAGSSYYPATDERVYKTENQYARAERKREPTTRRPIPGQSQNDDIDDYTDLNDESTRQNNPYIPPGHPFVVGNYPSVAGFPGNNANGILVGPGGPTGIIGRPPSQYPAGVVPSSFPTVQVGYPGYSNKPAFHGYSGQFPYGNHPQQYPHTQFAGAQYPQQPHYTEGYGLAPFNSGFNENLGFNTLFNGNFKPNYGFGFDEYPTRAEGKTASVKALNKKVDDKVTKNLKKF